MALPDAVGTAGGAINRPARRTSFTAPAVGVRRGRLRPNFCFLFSLCRMSPVPVQRCGRVRHNNYGTRTRRFMNADFQRRMRLPMLFTQLRSPPTSATFHSAHLPRASLLPWQPGGATLRTNATSHCLGVRRLPFFTIPHHAG